MTVIAAKAIDRDRRRLLVDRSGAPLTAAGEMTDSGMTLLVQ
jgi:hypothetical protein